MKIDYDFKEIYSLQFNIIRLSSVNSTVVNWRLVFCCRLNINKVDSNLLRSNAIAYLFSHVCLKLVT